MLKRWTWMILILISLVALWGCSDDDDPVAPSATTFETVATAGSAVVNDDATTPGVITASDLKALVDVDGVTVIDIRRPDAFVAGHIPGAYPSSLTTLMADLGSGAIPNDKPYVVVCYSGQSAGHAKLAMEMMGMEVSSLLFGMSSWSEATRSPWDNATVLADEADRNVLTNPETTNNNGDLTTHAYPVLSETGSDVVAQRVDDMLANGFKGMSYDQVMALPEVFIINYFGQADYEGTGTSGVPGHIPGAFQFTPYASMGMDQMLSNIPTDIPVVVYCWTGQHSSQITAYLNMLGYDAYSLTYGSNKLFYDDLTAHKWTAGAYNDFDLEYGEAPTPVFDAIATAGTPIINDNGTTPGVIAASDLEPLVTADAVTVIDIRAQGDYDAGHITGAVHSSLGTLLSDLTDGTIPTGKPYVVVCYSGQSAGHAKLAMEMLDYDVSSLLFGMSSWSSATRGPWDNATINAAVPDRNVLTNPETENNNGDLTGHSYPALSGDVGTAVLDAATAMLTAGFKGISYDGLLALPEAFVINYFGQADYEGTGTSGVPGHIPGAFQFTPYASLDMDEMLANIPTDIPVVVYCWTGQHSSQITAYLNMLGYDAYSLTYGSNKLFYDDLTAHKWTTGAYNDFPLEVTPTS